MGLFSIICDLDEKYDEAGVFGKIGYFLLTVFVAWVITLFATWILRVVWNFGSWLFGFNSFYVNPEYAKLRWQGNPYLDFPVIRPEG